MPRYRFACTNFPSGLLRSLASSVALEGDPAEALRRRYGARPTPTLIQDTWPVLLTTWLPNDPDSRGALAERLQELRLGRSDMSIRGKQGQLDYLRTCRNSAKLRDAALAVFLTAGESPQGATGARKVSVPTVRSTEEADTGDGARGSRSARRRTPVHEERATDGGQDLNAWAEAVLCESLELDEIKRDSDGDISILRGSSVLFVRQHDSKSPFLHIFAPLLRNFRTSPDVYEAVNAINAQVPMAKALVAADGQLIMLQADVLIATLSSSEFMFAVDMVSNAADHFDTLLQKRFGGELMLADDYSDSTDV